MEGKITFSILTEHHEGPIGGDWRYWVEAKVFNQGLKGQGTIKVDKHTFPQKVTQEPPGPPPPILLSAGDSANQVKINLTFEATEVDLFKNDVGIAHFDFVLDFPEPGEEPTVIEKLISVGVVESPGLTGEASIFTLKVRLVLSLD
jgi:hypothetical protein